MTAVKNYGINIPEVGITAIARDINRLNNISDAVAQTTISKKNEIQGLREACRVVRERLVKAEAELASHKRWRWTR